MGIDVNLYAEGVVSDEELAAAIEYLRHRLDYFVWQPSHGEERSILTRRGWSSSPDPDGTRIEVNTLERYYGPHYERGCWPRIYGAILLLRAALPQCTIYYGGDTSDDGLEATDELLTEYWAHFLGPDGDAYRRR